MHPIKRGILVVLLSLGAIGGFTHGFARMAQCHGGCAAQSQRDEFEEHIADVCTRSAQRVYDEQAEREAEQHLHRGGWGGPQWGGPPPSWGPPPQYWGAPPPPPAAPLAPAAAPVVPVVPAAPTE